MYMGSPAAVGTIWSISLSGSPPRASTFSRRNLVTPSILSMMSPGFGKTKWFILCRTNLSFTRYVSLICPPERTRTRASFGQPKARSTCSVSAVLLLICFPPITIFSCFRISVRPG